MIEFKDKGRLRGAKWFFSIGLVLFIFFVLLRWTIVLHFLKFDPVWNSYLGKIFWAISWSFMGFAYLAFMLSKNNCCSAPIKLFKLLEFIGNSNTSLPDEFEKLFIDKDQLDLKLRERDKAFEIIKELKLKNLLNERAASYIEKQINLENAFPSYFYNYIPNLVINSLIVFTFMEVFLKIFKFGESSGFIYYSLSLALCFSLGYHIDTYGRLGYMLGRFFSFFSKS